VLEEDVAADDVLIFGSDHAAERLVGNLLQFGLVAEVGTVQSSPFSFFFNH
jgi:hypothetical protein